MDTGGAEPRARAGDDPRDSVSASVRFPDDLGREQAALSASHRDVIDNHRAPDGRDNDATDADNFLFADSEYAFEDVKHEKSFVDPFNLNNENTFQARIENAFQQNLPSAFRGPSQSSELTDPGRLPRVGAHLERLTSSNNIRNKDKPTTFELQEAENIEIIEEVERPSVLNRFVTSSDNSRGKHAVTPNLRNISTKRRPNNIVESATAAEQHDAGSVGVVSSGGGSDSGQDEIQIVHGIIQDEEDNDVHQNIEGHSEIFLETLGINASNGSNKIREKTPRNKQNGVNLESKAQRSGSKIAGTFSLLTAPRTVSKSLDTNFDVDKKQILFRSEDVSLLSQNERSSGRKLPKLTGQQQQQRRLPKHFAGHSEKNGDKLTVVDLPNIGNIEDLATVIENNDTEGNVRRTVIIKNTPQAFQAFGIKNAPREILKLKSMKPFIGPQNVVTLPPVVETKTLAQGFQGFGLKEIPTSRNPIPFQAVTDTNIDTVQENPIESKPLEEDDIFVRQSDGNFNNPGRVSTIEKIETETERNNPDAFSAFEIASKLETFPVASADDPSKSGEGKNVESSKSTTLDIESSEDFSTDGFGRQVSLFNVNNEDAPSENKSEEVKNVEFSKLTALDNESSEVYSTDDFGRQVSFFNVDSEDSNLIKTFERNDTDGNVLRTVIIKNTPEALKRFGITNVPQNIVAPPSPSPSPSISPPSTISDSSQNLVKEINEVFSFEDSQDEKQYEEIYVDADDNVLIIPDYEELNDELTTVSSNDIDDTIHNFSLDSSGKVDHNVQTSNPLQKLKPHLSESAKLSEIDDKETEIDGEESPSLKTLFYEDLSHEIFKEDRGNLTPDLSLDNLENEDYESFIDIEAPTIDLSINTVADSNVIIDNFKNRFFAQDDQDNRSPKEQDDVPFEVTHDNSDIVVNVVSVPNKQLPIIFPAQQPAQHGISQPTIPTQNIFINDQQQSSVNSPVTTNVIDTHGFVQSDGNVENSFGQVNTFVSPPAPSSLPLGNNFSQDQEQANPVISANAPFVETFPAPPPQSIPSHISLPSSPTLGRDQQLISTSAQLPSSSPDEDIIPASSSFDQHDASISTAPVSTANNIINTINNNFPITAANTITSHRNSHNGLITTSNANSINLNSGPSVNVGLSANSNANTIVVTPAPMQFQSASGRIRMPVTFEYGFEPMTGGPVEPPTPRPAVFRPPVPPPVTRTTLPPPLAPPVKHFVRPRQTNIVEFYQQPSVLDRISGIIHNVSKSFKTILT